MTTDHIALTFGSEQIQTWNATNRDFKGQRRKLLHNFVRLLFLILVVFAVIILVNILTTSYRIMSVNQLRETTKFQRNAGNSSLANYLEHEVRVLCWILTNPKNHKSKAKAVRKTWGKRCTKLLFVTTQADDELETLVVDIEEKYENIWGKTRHTFKYLYEHHLNDYDWFMKADDDTFVFMENLRYMLYSYSPTIPIWFGFNFKLGASKQAKHSYMSGGSGYTLSREALRRFGDIALNTPSGCKLHADTGAEDAEMGLCLKTASVLAGDSRDASMKLRYDIFNPDAALISNFWGKGFWYQKQSFYQAHLSRDSLSDYAVAFHYVSPEDMHLYEYLIYDLEVVGLERAEEYLPKKLQANEVVIPASDNDKE